MNLKNPIFISLFSGLILTFGIPAEGEIESPKKQMKQGG